MKADLPSNEAARLEALERYEIMDSSAEKAFDDFTFLASQICQTPVSLITLLDSERQWFKSKVGVEAPEMPRDVSFCAHAILRPDELLLVPDAAEDIRFWDNPLVTGDPNVRSYAGAPLVTPDGHALGTLCVVDSVPRELDEAQQEALRALGRQVVAQLELRRQAQELERAIEKSQRDEEAARRSEERASAVVQASLDCIISFDSRDRIIEWNPSAERTFGYTREEAVGQLMVDLIVPERLRERHMKPLSVGFLSGERAILNTRVELPACRRDGTELTVELAITHLNEETSVYTSYLRDVTERQQTKRDLRESQERAERHAANVPGVVYQFVLRADGTTGVPYVSEGCRTLYQLEPEQIERDADVLLGLIHPQDRPGMDASIKESARTLSPWHWEGRIILPPGVEKWLQCESRPQKQQNGDILWDGLAMDITAHKRDEERLHRQLQRMNALRDIDMAISASLDLRLTLKIFLDQVTSQLGVDAASMLLLNPHTQILNWAEGRGFRSHDMHHISLRLDEDEDRAGKAVLERRIINIADVHDVIDNSLRGPLVLQEGFVSYYGVPIIAKGQVKGVLELWHRAPLEPDAEWLDFLANLGGQAAIAVENSMMFEDLQRSNMELALAYDTTLEGWSHALDLRDKETEGHTQRVATLTVQLARAMNMNEAELIHVRRGALLHDIGKMGIPDNILLKPGKLTDEEWVIMRKHPVYAFELLSPIQYLRPALDVPYCHHEKWDGSGYPRGLKSEQIPMCARIFAIIDVWDALRSDRPYRAGWEAGRVREHIKEGSGSHFDPAVVEAFLALDLENRPILSSSHV